MELKETWLVDYARTPFSRSRGKQPERDVFGEIPGVQLCAQLINAFFDEDRFLAGKGVKREDITRGQVLAKPGSVTPHQEFEGEIYILSKEEGGRHTPFFTGYKPQFYIRTTDVTGEVTLPEGTEMIMPGDTVNLKVKLMLPVALEQKQRFAIREGGKTVGAGVVTKIKK